MVTPGFVDGHTHMDAQLFWDPLGTSSCWHGVTTVVMGNCGFTLAPARADARALVVRNLERAEDIDPGALAAGIDWQWETFAEYLDAVDRQPKGINYAAQIGHSALRTWAMGERAFEQEASDDDLALMERELRDAMQAGAVGFTTSRIDQHETSDDRPVASRLASWDEVCRLVGVLSDVGTGVFEIAPQFNRGMDPTERAAISDAMRDARGGVAGADDVRRRRREPVGADAPARRRNRRRRRPHVRPDPQPRHLRRALVPEPHALRPPAGVERGARAAASRAARGAARRVVAAQARRRREPRRLRACHRGRSTTTRLHEDARLRPPGAAESHRRRSRRRARHGSRRAHPRPRDRQRAPPALHPADHAGRRRRSCSQR